MPDELRTLFSPCACREYPEVMIHVANARPQPIFHPTGLKSPLSSASACLLLLLTLSSSAMAATFFVSPDGDDAASGTPDAPFATLARAQQAARPLTGKEPVAVIVRGGTYYLPSTLVFTSADSGSANAPVLYRAAPSEVVILSGGQELELQWEPSRNGIWTAKVPLADNDSTRGGTNEPFDQFFVNGQRMPMARYPNEDQTVRPYDGYAADAFSPERAVGWANPTGGYIHAMHRHHWGGYHYRITGKDPAGHILYEGGWQNNRQLGMHPEHRYVENIYEELDAPGEWFHDDTAHTLYFFPPTGLDLNNATFEVVRLRHLVELQGQPDDPVRFVTFQGFTFQHAARTFMDTREPLLRSDWTIYRGGAVLFRGTEDCTLADAIFDQVGGNAIFVDHYNRRVSIRGCLIQDAGGNGVAFVGDPGAVRNPLFEYNQRQHFDDIDLIPGPATSHYPADCLVEDCLITRIGRVEKQAAAVQISMARRITVRHCSIYEVPRAGINISEGTWGGHLIEGCDVFDTVLETGDHGSFNSWGRDRYWGLEGIDLNTVTLGEHRNLPLLDAVETTVIRHNRWRCDHGWDIDLDDGSSNYEIRDNLCLNGGIKLREGFHRLVENNIMVDNSFHPHVWYGNSLDVFRRNIVFTHYQPIQVNPPWGLECDRNLLHQPDQFVPVPARQLQQQSGRDLHSLAADARFLDPATGDYRVAEDSPALALGFQNFAMDQFGVRSPTLRAIAKSPVLPAAPTPSIDESDPTGRVIWQGATFRELIGEEYSALGVARDSGGVVVIEVKPASPAARAGLQVNDLVQGVNRQAIADLGTWRAAIADLPENTSVQLEIIRNQNRIEIAVAVQQLN
jgi:hypothetical protein